MGQTLAAAKSFSFQSHSMTDEILHNGQKVQLARNQKVIVRRPDKAAVDVIGDIDQLQGRYDGKHFVLYNPKTNTFAQIDTPPTIDKTLDELVARYNMVLPLADLYFPDPYATLIERVRSGQHLGDGYVMDVKCDHLAFRQETVDWQIWIEQGDRPVPRKLVITYKDSPGHPQFTVFLSNWDLSAKPADDAFTFKPPAGAKQVDFAAPAPTPVPPASTPPAAPQKQ
jgi:hypothetical protein